MTIQHMDMPPTQSENPAASADAIASAQGKVMRPTPELAEAMARGYEPKDISLRGLFIFLGTLVVSLLVVLVAIYAIMMALVEHDRSHDPLGTTASVNKPEVYAPLQPSLGHNTDDWVDMATMREQTQQVLTTAGVSPTGRRWIPIAEAMDKVVPMLYVSAHPVVTPMHVPEQPADSYEGFIPTKDKPAPHPTIYPQVEQPAE